MFEHRGNTGYRNAIGIGTWWTSWMNYFTLQAFGKLGSLFLWVTQLMLHTYRTQEKRWLGVLKVCCIYTYTLYIYIYIFLTLRNDRPNWRLHVLGVAPQLLWPVDCANLPVDTSAVIHVSWINSNLVNCVFFQRSNLLYIFVNSWLKCGFHVSIFFVDTHYSLHAYWFCCWYSNHTYP